MTKFRVYRPAGSVIGGDLDLVTHNDTEFHLLPERTLLVSDEVRVDDGVEVVGDWDLGHGWDPDGAIAALTGKMMQRPRRWPPCESLAGFRARFEQWNARIEDPSLRDELVLD